MPNEDSPFKAIMLAFSGGGYRAAAFHLGLLKMFNELGLRQCIRGLSTISGGTIVGAAYIKSLVDGTPFEKFVEGFRTFLRNTNVVEKALQKLKETRTVNGIAVDASLIRSAANVYDEDYFGNMRFREILAKRNDLPEIAFNTTEFRVGNAFRFQSSISDDVGSGNNALRVPGKSGTNDAVRVADIVAASSCFPSGFEPMRFPSDFVWESTFDLAMVKKELGAKFDKEVPLMDGGVYDNQGIDSSKNIVRRKTDIDFDLFVISDVDNPSDNLLDDPVAEQSGFFTVIQVYIFLLVVMFLAFASSIAFIVNMIFRWDVLKESPVDLILLNIVPLFFSIAVFVLILGVKTKASELLAKVEKTMELAVWPAIQQLKVSEVFELIFSRVDSLVVMASSVFMKRIRGLEQDLVKKSTKTGPMSFFALIYGLETE
ncbi:MAG: patatin-like phospholipase family protein, partial [Acidobacteriota bacterium]|nr:patatin-like phospholipase family protein [Acidobacteriota bacterium]